MDTTQTSDMLFDYFVDKVFVGVTTLTIASCFFDGAAEYAYEHLAADVETGEVPNLLREFATSPRGGGGGNRTRVLKL